MHAVLSSPLATRYWSTPPHEDLEQTRAWLESMVSSPPDLSDDFIVEREGQLIGKAGFWRLPEIGFILHPDHWGQGLAYEALCPLIARAFERFPVEKLVADVDPANTGSLRLLGKLGFKEARREKNTWYIGGKWHDSIFLELPRPLS